MNTTHATADRSADHSPAAPGLITHAACAVAALAISGLIVAGQLGLAEHYTAAADAVMATQASQPVAQQSRPPTPRRS